MCRGEHDEANKVNRANRIRIEASNELSRDIDAVTEPSIQSVQFDRPMFDPNVAYSVVRVVMLLMVRSV